MVFTITLTKKRVTTEIVSSVLAKINRKMKAAKTKIIPSWTVRHATW